MIVFTSSHKSCSGDFHSGTTVVLARGPGGTELVRHNETGYLVDVRDPVETCKVVRMLIETPELRRRLAVKALSAVRSSEAYSWAHVTDILIEHYEEFKKMRPRLTSPREKPPAQSFKYVRSGT